MTADDLFDQSCTDIKRLGLERSPFTESIAPKSETLHSMFKFFKSTL